MSLLPEQSIQPAIQLRLDLSQEEVSARALYSQILRRRVTMVVNELHCFGITVEGLSYSELFDYQDTDLKTLRTALQKIIESHPNRVVRSKVMKESSEGFIAPHLAFQQELCSGGAGKTVQPLVS